MIKFKNSKQIYFYLYAILFVSNIAHAEKNTQVQYAVNMQDGGFILKEVGDSSLNVDRTYRSRSLDHGFFGMGWCSDFESQLIFQGRGVIRLVNCQSSRPSLFKVSETAASYVHSDDPTNKIVIKLGFYEHQINNEWIARYNFKGKLIEYRKNKTQFKLIYNTRLLPEKMMITEKNKTQLIQFKWHPLLDLIEKIKSGKQSQSFHYVGFNLISAKSENQNLNYLYDDLDNLINRKTSQKSDNLSILYNKVSDQVLKIEGLCLEFYSYTKSSQKRTVSTVSKSCQKQSSKKEFIFEYDKNLLKPSTIKMTETPLSLKERIALKMDGE